ncbi:MAG: ABC transporter ATP-binding protein [Alphaproteobacteria bacterium]|nr:ABC transporter ATP-binding protein [Alphaproteobacteria bacterium]
MTPSTPRPADPAPVLAIEDLRIRFVTRDGAVRAVNGLSLSVGRGETLGIVGESGSGKSQTFLAAMGLLARNARVEGSIRFEGREMIGAGPRALNAVRGKRMTMIFQDPMTSLTPHMRIGRQLTEVLEHHEGLSREAARARAVEMLELARIPDARARLASYPHEFSGGMRQRVMIALALLTNPALVIADEPTTALDVTVQAQILALLARMTASGETSVILISHDLGVIAGLCDRVVVMYAGEVMEEGPAEALFANPQHPYTRGLLRSVPRLDRAGGDLVPIAGQPPDLEALPPGCPFAPRCPHVFDRCHTEHPALRPAAAVPSWRKACHLDGFETPPQREGA